MPLSPLLLPAGLAGMIRGSDARCIIAQSSMLPVLEAIRDQLPPHVLLTDGAAGGFGDWQALSAGAAGNAGAGGRHAR